MLVLDDDHCVRVLLQVGLERSDFTVWLARNALEALELYREHYHEIDLVLFDADLPGLAGQQILRAFHKLRLGVLACMMCCNLSENRKREILECGAAETIAKPFHLEELTSLLSRLATTEPSRLINPERRDAESP